MEITIVLVLLVVGILFFLLELFLIPGISVAGIAGTIFMGVAIYYAYSHIGATAGHITVFGSLFLSGTSVWVFIRSKALDKLSLKTDISSKNDPLEKTNIKIGDTGVTVSRLAPMGKVKINGSVVEAKTNGDFVDQAVQVKVLAVMNTNILVEKITD